MKTESPSGQAVTGSAPGAVGSEKGEGSTVQTPSAPEKESAKPFMSLQDAIKAELSALGGGEKELTESGKSAKSGKAEDSSAEDDGEDTDDSESSETDEDEKKETEDSEDEESEDEDGEEDSEEEEESEEESNIPRKRLNKEIEKTKRERARREEAEALAEEWKTKHEELNGQMSKFQEASDFIDYVIEAAQFMPDLKEFLETHPVFTGKTPTAENFDDAESYARWREREAEKRLSKKQGEAEVQANSEKQIGEIFDRFEAEIEELRSDEKMAKYVDEDHMKEIRSFLEEQGIASLLTGSKRFDSVSKVAKFLFIDEMMADIKKTAAKDTVKKIDKSRKKVSLKGKPSASGPKPLPKHATLMDHIRAEIASSKI